MAKFVGYIGFEGVCEEVEPGIWENSSEEKKVLGEIYRNILKHYDSDNVNSKIDISNQIEFVGSPYFRDNWMHMKYCVWRGQKWKITNVDILDYPNIKIDLGGLYLENES